MTREETIEILNNVSFFAPSEINVDKAIEMAISALKGGDAEMNETKSPHMQQSPDNVEDLISRAHAIEAVRKAYFDKDIQSAKDDPCIVDAMTDWAIRQIKALPSADVVSREEYERLEGLYDAIRIYDSSAEAKGDLISRQDAVNIIKRYRHRLQGRGQTYGFLLEEFEHQIPSASADAVQGWIPCSERLPKEDEYVGNVCKYYLIQDEYGDMHVAHLSGRGWETIESVKALGCYVVAWMPLPEPYKGGEDE